MASNGTSQSTQSASQQAISAQAQAQSAAASANIITALTSVLKNSSGENVQNDRIATLLLQNMTQLSELARQGKINQQQIMQVRL